MTAGQWFILGAAIAVCLMALGALALEFAKDACREHYRRAGVAWDSHVDDALEVTR